MEQFQNIFGRVLRRTQSSGIKMENGMQLFCELKNPSWD